MHRAGVVARDEWRCRFASLGGCSGRLQADHILKISALRRHRQQLPLERWRSQLSEGELRFIATPLEQLIADARNGWLLCTDGHHVPKDRGEIPVEQQINRWPVEMFSFIDDFDLGRLVHVEFGSDAVVRIRGHGRSSDSPFTGWID